MITNAECLIYGNREYNRGLKDGYNKALDDFAEEIKKISYEDVLHQVYAIDVDNVLTTLRKN